MRKFQGFLFVLKRSYICYYIICMTVPLNRKKSTCDTWKNAVYFISKALFVCEKINFRILDIQIS